MKALRFKTMADLDFKFTKYMALAKAEDLDVSKGTVHLHDVALQAESLHYELDLKDVWLTERRWTMLTRQYLNHEALIVWLDQIEKHMKNRGRGQAFMRSQYVQPHRKEKKQSRRWGSCMIGWSFRAYPKPTLTMHSRTSFIGYMARLDLGVAHHLGRLVAERLDLDVEDISFVWFLDSAQLHQFRALSWWFHDPNLLEIEHGGRPALKNAQSYYRRYKELNDEGFRYGDHSFGSHLTPRKRMNTEIYGYEFAKQFEGGTRLGPSAARASKPLPSVTLDELSLDKLGKTEGMELNDSVLDGSDD